MLASQILRPAEQRAWSAATAFYSMTYADKDLTVSLEMILIKNQLGDFETCEDLAGFKEKILRRQGFLQSSRKHWTRGARLSRSPLARSTIAPIAAGFPRSRHSSAATDSTSLIASPKSTRPTVPKERIRVDVTSYASSTAHTPRSNRSVSPFPALTRAIRAPESSRGFIS